MKKYYKWKNKTIGNFLYAVEEDFFITQFGFGDIEIENAIFEKTNLICKLIYQSDEYFKGNLKKFDIKYKIKQNTQFEHEVISRVLKIPYGNTKSYRDIAVEIGRKNAYRAVANVVSKNKLLLIVPCHRVILSSGKTGGYVSGTQLKQKLLDLEKKKTV